MYVSSSVFQEVMNLVYLFHCIFIVSIHTVPNTNAQPFELVQWFIFNLKKNSLNRT
jgi:hypothetical protein